jgi:hypothetical protein
MPTTKRILKMEMYIKLLDTVSKMDHVEPKKSTSTVSKLGSFDAL